MNRFNAKTLVWSIRNLLLVGGIMLFTSGCGNAEIPGLAELKKNLSEVLKSLTESIAKVTKDPKSAEAAVSDLTKADESLTKLVPLYDKLPKVGQEQIHGILREIFEKLKKDFEGIKAKIDVAKFKDTMTDLLKKLAPLAGSKV